MNLETILTDKLIFLDKPLHSKDEVFHFVGDVLQKNKRLTDASLFVKDLYVREKMGPTNMGNGIAIPHSKSPVILKPTVVFIRLQKPITWEGSEDGAKLIFLLAVPDSNEDVTHLEVISTIASLLMEEDFVTILHNTNDSKDIIHYINQELEGDHI